MCTLWRTLCISVLFFLSNSCVTTGHDTIVIRHKNLWLLVPYITHYNTAKYVFFFISVSITVAGFMCMLSKQLFLHLYMKVSEAFFFQIIILFHKHSVIKGLEEKGRILPYLLSTSSARFTYTYKLTGWLLQRAHFYT